MDEQLLRQTIANNLLYYRKKANLTQLEIAEKLNYSDKSISKWERAEGVPDIYILCQLAEFYKISVNYLLSDSPKKQISDYNRNKDIISFLSTGIVWLVAVIFFVFLELLVPSINKTWLSFIYAIPLSLIVLIVFNRLWRRHVVCFILVSLLIWGVILSIYLSLLLANIWLIFIIGIPLQAMTVLWFLLKRPLK
jgi:transcriptional regulator with XRE-family HTH domain